MKTALRTVLGIVILLTAFNFTVDAGNKVKKKLYGTWKVEAPEAPYEYQEAEIEFLKENGLDKVKILTDYDVIYAKNLVVDGNNVSFEFEVENLRCVARLKYKKDKLKGMVETDQGDIAVTMTKKK